MKKAIITILISGLIVTGAIVFRQITSDPVKLTLEPDHLDILVSLDGEEDEYYEELTLRADGKKVNSKKVSWRSDDPGIAEADEYGWVTSMGVGTTVITAEFKGTTAKCAVTVVQKITSDTRGE